MWIKAPASSLERMARGTWPTWAIGMPPTNMAAFTTRLLPTAPVGKRAPRHITLTRPHWPSTARASYLRLGMVTPTTLALPAPKWRICVCIKKQAAAGPRRNSSPRRRAANPLTPVFRRNGQRCNSTARKRWSFCSFYWGKAMWSQRCTMAA